MPVVATIVGAFASLHLTAAFAGENSAKTPECKEITTRLVEQTGARFDHLSPSGGSVFFSNPRMVLICDPKFITYVSLTWNSSGYPSNEWFTVLAKAGAAVTGAAQKPLEDAAHRCHRAALRDRTELAEANLNDAKIDCQAFTRDGGGVVINVGKPDPK
ncbi:hypothetical protein [Bradyrhizobium sp. NAS96.2]|uniref:hypothetical protein n=1 Tax=Bradyrhizobium sp. NAS96.2 TaxID=1680160 RepID=UPI00093A31C9|nr:hypothetical protein [Bradyrhizobium sp. NAS96.2]OKO76374.1 hypothetical protein AC628_18140 [Bradyrhizobium sp. NAS96.2]